MNRLPKNEIVNRERIIKLSEKILDLYNISFTYDTNSKTDSLMRVNSLLERDQIAFAYKVIIPEICKFPYTFIKSLEFPVLKFVTNINLYKPVTHPLIMKRLYKGLFPLDNLPSDEDKRIHFYRMLFYTIKSRSLAFDYDWGQEIPPPIVLGYIKDQNRHFFAEQTDAFIDVFRDFKKFLVGGKERIRIAELFGELMESIDPIAINEKFWESVIEFNELERKLNLN